MQAKTTSWEQQLANIKHVMQAAREELNAPRPRRGRRHRTKIVPERKPSDAPDIRKEEREYEESERRAREEQAEIVRNPYGSPFYPVDR
jgi:hypothetical protein